MEEMDREQAMERMHAWCLLHLHVHPDAVPMPVLLQAHSMWLEQQQQQQDGMLLLLRMQAQYAVLVARALGQEWNAESIWPGLFGVEGDQERMTLTAEQRLELERNMNAMVAGHLAQNETTHE